MGKCTRVISGQKDTQNNSLWREYKKRKIFKK
jgi:hypothetical protein